MVLDIINPGEMNGKWLIWIFRYGRSRKWGFHKDQAYEKSCMDITKPAEVDGVSGELTDKATANKSQQLGKQQLD
ncbi:hypothetical protein C5167_042560 [Papaver somniferum]|uniref:Uncharacterized protein n=1 Tax=Papaver somniferum TaxID=3469 RepID=A0A4Y7L737_PAPSO|nr:hypothetical protein C5167_042560 [Papaver somniferum]